MTDIEREAMGLWNWGAFLDRMIFLINTKLWFKSKLSINAPPLLANAKLQNFDLAQYFNQHTPKMNTTATKITSNYPF